MALFTGSNSNLVQASSCSDVKERIIHGQNWIVEAQKENGLFTYEYNIVEGKHIDDDNIVRQTGGFWALVDSLQFKRNEEILETINRFRKKIDTLVVHSRAGDEEIAYIEFQDLGKINTSALYVLSLLELEENGIELSATEKENLPLIIKGMRLMSDEEGGFWYIYHMPSEHNKITAYGTGEAIYALAAYYHSRGDIEGAKWVYDQFQKYFERYIKSAENFMATESKAFFSWGIYGLAALNQSLPIDYKDTVQYMVDSALTYRAETDDCKDRGCIIGPSITDAPFLEGFVQAYHLAKKYDKGSEETQKIKEFIDLALKDLNGFQILQFHRGFAGITDENLIKERRKEVIGSFCTGEKCENIRVDYTQHAISAMMYYYNEFCTVSENLQEN
jgi:hypothetical protein